VAPAYPEPGLIPLRPLLVSDILRASFRALGRYPGALIGANLLMVLGGLIILGVYSAATIPFAVHIVQSVPNAHDLSRNQDWSLVGLVGGGLLLLFLVWLTITAFSSVISALAAGRGSVGRPFRFGEAFGEIRANGLRALRLYAVLASMLYVGPLLLVGLAFELPAALTGSRVLAALGILVWVPVGALSLFFAIRLRFAAPAFILERQTIRQTLSRVWFLSRDAWWRIFGITLLVGVIAGGISFILRIPLSLFSVLAGGISGAAADDSGTVAGVIAYMLLIGTAFVVQIALQPLGQLTACFLYIDQRIRKDSLDAALAAEAGIVWTPPSPFTQQHGPAQTSAPAAGPAPETEAGAGAGATVADEPAGTASTTTLASEAEPEAEVPPQPEASPEDAAPEDAPPAPRDQNRDEPGAPPATP